MVEIQVIEHNLHKLLHPTGLHLEEPLLIQAEGQTTSVQSLAAKSKRTLHMYFVTGMIKVFNFDVYALLDPKTSLYFVTPYVTNLFEILLEKLCEPLCVDFYPYWRVYSNGKSLS